MTRREPAQLSGVLRGSGSMRGDLSVGDVVRRVRDADLSEDRLREVYAELDRRSVSPEQFAKANPDVAPIVGDLVGTYGVAALNLLFAVLAVLIAIHYGERQTDLAEQQVELGRQQLRQDERQQDRPATTGALTDDDIDRIVKACREADRPTTKRPPPPPREQHR